MFCLLYKIFHIYNIWKNLLFLRNRQQEQGWFCANHFFLRSKEFKAGLKSVKSRSYRNQSYSLQRKFFFLCCLLIKEESISSQDLPMTGQVSCPKSLWDAYLDFLVEGLWSFCLSKIDNSFLSSNFFY